MYIPELSLDAYIALSVVLATLWLYSSFSSKDRFLSAFLLLHTLYILHALLVSPPQNIFSSLKLPLNIPSEYLYAKLVESYGGETNLPSSVASLPKRLGSMELRTLYVRYIALTCPFLFHQVFKRLCRFGHEVITSCVHCRSSDDYALYAFPTPLSEYIREIAFIGVSIKLISSLSIHSND